MAEELATKIAEKLRDPNNYKNFLRYVLSNDDDLTIDDSFDKAERTENQSDEDTPKIRNTI